MAKPNSGSVFDDILVKFSSDEDRATFQELAERNSELKESVLRQSDYSRRLNEFNTKIGALEQEVTPWRGWREQYWDEAAGKTKKELEYEQQLESTKAEKERLEALVEFGGGDMDFNELETWGKKFKETNGLVDKTVIDGKAKELTDYVNGVNQFTAQASVDTQWLNMKHQKEFGDPFDPRDFLKAANDKGRLDLRDFYEKDFVLDARNKKRDENHAAEIKRVQTEKDEAIAKMQQETDAKLDRMRSMSPSGSPTDSGEGSMSEMQKTLMGMPKDDKAPETTGPIGGGSAAAMAAAQYRETGSV